MSDGKRSSKSGCSRMSEFLLDTSYLIDLVYADDDAVALHEEIGGMAATATPCLYELAKFVESDLEELFAAREVLSLTPSDATEAGRVYREHHDAGDLLGEMDTLISGVARSRDLTLVTRDDDFKRVSDLDCQYY